MLSIGLLSCGEGMCLKMVADVLKTICLREVCYIKMQSFSPFQNDFVSLQPQTKRQMARLKVLIPRENKLTPEQRREALELGKLGEQMATKYLEDNGYTILERNYRKGHLEIDIIALDPHSEFNAPYSDMNGLGDLVIIEVKTRSYDTVLQPEDAVDHKKRLNLIRLGNQYVRSHGRKENVRLDVIAIVKNEKGVDFRHIKNAFNVMRF